jgi:hypothetical protein
VLTPGNTPTPFCRPAPDRAADDCEPGEHAPRLTPPGPRIDTPGPAHQDTPREPSQEIIADVDGVLQPALVVGLGRLGLGVLRQLRQQLSEQFGDPDALGHVRLLYLDTDPETTQLACRGRPDLALRPSEIALARLQRGSHYLKNGQNVVAGWLNPRILHRMQRQQTPSGVRALGRLAFVDNYLPLARRLETELSECCRPEALLQTARQTHLGIRSEIPRVYLVTGLGGGSGSGMLLDVAYTIRRLLRAQGHERAEVVGVLLLPHATPDPARSVDLANTFAALTELRRFGAPDSVFTASYELEGCNSLQAFSEHGPPFQRCALFTLPDPRGSGAADGDGPPPLPPNIERVLGRAGHLLYTELATLLGRTADEVRDETAKQPQRNGQGGKLAGGRARGPVRYHASGMYRLLWPRRQLLDQAARSVCRRVVERWMSKDGRPVREPLKAWVKERWEHLGLAQTHLIARFQKSCTHDLQQAPEDVFAAIAASVLPPPGPRPIDADFTLRPAAVCEALTRLEQLLGIPEECRKGDGQDSLAPDEPGQLERALADTAASLRTEYEQKLAEVAVRLIEDPHYRLAGAEEALRQLSAEVEEALQLHEDLCSELQQRAIAAYQRLQSLLASPTPLLHSTPSRRAGFLRRTPTQPGPAIEVLELLRNYPKWRYQSLVLARVNTLYISLRGQLSDQLREVDYCRARLTELLGMLTPPETNGRRGAPVAGRCLLPAGCRSLDEAVRRLDKAVGPEQLVELDRRIQTLVRKQCRALVRVCLTSATVLRGLLPVLLQEVRKFLEPRLDASDVTQLYLEQHQAQQPSRPPPPRQRVAQSGPASPL